MRQEWPCPRQDFVKVRDVMLFDFGGTLDGDGERWAVRFHSAYQVRGGRLALDDFERLFRESDRQLELDPTVRTMGFRDMVTRQAELLWPSLPDGQSIDRASVAEHFYLDAVRTVERNRRVLQALADHYRLAVVSNFTGNLDRCLAELGLSNLFTVIADSAVVGRAKPDPRIFRHALEALGAEPAGSWMIGDNFETDIRPAAALGMSTCWLAPPGRPAPTERVATRRISRLTDLPALLDRCTG
jgi:HAD superfamily hydrolase (TIGR01509 family)